MKKTLLFLSLLAASGMSAQWVEQNSNFSAASRGVNNFEIIDANTVWALGYDGTAAAATVQEFTRTTDGGANWVTGNIEIFDPSLTITNLSAVNATTAYAGAVDADLGGGGVYKTTDGGQNWDNSNPAGYTSATSYFNVVHFFNENNGLTQGDPVGAGNGEFEVYLTNNGGTTWTAAPAAALPDPAAGEYGYNGGNVAAGNSFWFVTNRGKLYRTTDMGATWTKLDTPISDFSGANTGGQIFFSDNNNGILIARTGTQAAGTYTLYKTNNGGTSWGTGVSYTAPYRNVSYIKGTTVLVGTGFTGTGATRVDSSAYSLDNGTTWTTIDTGTQRTDIAFLDGSTGWAGGFTDPVSGLGGVFKYTGAALGIGDFASNKSFKVYPNPTNSQLNLSGASINEVAVYDLLGKQVMTQKFSAQDQVSLNVSGLETGMYVLTATNDSGAKETVKFAKQ
ncbi:BNR/Asp-box repeat protein [compost metagenome]